MNSEMASTALREKAAKLILGVTIETIMLAGKPKKGWFTTEEQDEWFPLELFNPLERWDHCGMIIEAMQARGHELVAGTHVIQFMGEDPSSFVARSDSDSAGIGPLTPLKITQAAIKLMEAQ